jgi:hypothetical protein
MIDSIAAWKTGAPVADAEKRAAPVEPLSA